MECRYCLYEYRTMSRCLDCDGDKFIDVRDLVSEWSIRSKSISEITRNLKKREGIDISRGSVENRIMTYLDNEYIKADESLKS